jgi:pimeloyl-ACP methyl ester carboxylesterase
MPIEPRHGEVKCLGPAGLHAMRYTEWGEPGNPRVLLCVHGLTRVGRDFDRLARALADRFRVVCPDVVGRGQSDWLADPAHYQLPQYVADMVTLVARLGVPQIDWLGTSMGGLIGMSLAGQPGAPIRRLILNDVGPTLDPAALARIGEYVGRPVRCARFEALVDYVATISAGFGLTRREDWVEATEHVVRRDGDGWILHYDPRIGAAFRAITPEIAAAGEAALWALYERIAGPVLLLRGEHSDLLSPATAEAMTRRGPRAQRIDIAGVGHAPMFFDAHQIALVRDFLLGD